MVYYSKKFGGVGGVPALPLPLMEEVNNPMTANVIGGGGNGAGADGAPALPLPLMKQVNNPVNAYIIGGGGHGAGAGGAPALPLPLIEQVNNPVNAIVIGAGGIGAGAGVPVPVNNIPFALYNGVVCRMLFLLLSQKTIKL